MSLLFQNEGESCCNHASYYKMYYCIMRCHTSLSTRWLTKHSPYRNTATALVTEDAKHHRKHALYTQLPTCTEKREKDRMKERRKEISCSSSDAAGYEEIISCLTFFVSAGQRFNDQQSSIFHYNQRYSLTLGNLSKKFRPVQAHNTDLVQLWGCALLSPKCHLFREKKEKVNFFPFFFLEWHSS